ncbi:ASCH domain-containing protein [Streptomyces scabiei]|uniref:ASCH domain-containing protein n=1 Tax=Streptomyces scabiei TaxID=1930 RepID=UPI0029AFCB98|nr:ASCH domain-containing protein [Streptomyces scabiei]MDX3118637.1 ASCH domain-containing protein [Streptomyces scabiei]
MDSSLQLPTEEDMELVEFAQRIVEANGDGEVHTVGAAVRDARGRMFGGINLYHFTGGPCAELVALGHARAAGAREPATIVAVGDRGRGVLAPCGRDRQVLLDHHPDIRVLVPTADGVRSIAVAGLLPYSYVWADHAAAPEPGCPATATQSMHFHRDYLDAVRTGRKTTTVRFRDSVATGPVNLVFELDEEVVLQGVVTQIISKNVDELTEQDAVADGFRDLEELHDRLRYHYPDIGPADGIAVVHFRSAGA